MNECYETENIVNICSRCSAFHHINSLKENMKQQWNIPWKWSHKKSLQWKLSINFFVRKERQENVFPSLVTSPQKINSFQLFWVLCQFEQVLSQCVLSPLVPVFNNTILVLSFVSSLCWAESSLEWTLVPKLMFLHLFTELFHKDTRFLLKLHNFYWKSVPFFKSVKNFFVSLWKILKKMFMLPVICLVMCEVLWCYVTPKVIIRRKAIDSPMDYTFLASICKLSQGDPQEMINTTVCGIIVQAALFDRDYLFSWYSTVLWLGNQQN